MISPHTPPGTKIVVSWNPGAFEELLSVVHPNHFHRFTKDDIKDRISIGDIFTLHAIIPCELTVSGFFAQLEEIEGGYALEHFSIAQLPKSLTDILISVPILENA